MPSSSNQSESIPLTSQHVIAPHRGAAPEWEHDYERVGDLPSGGQADVYQARHRTTGELVAIKVPNNRGESAARFRREVAELIKCRHRHVMPVLAHGDDWYAMPLADGSLRALAPELSDEGRLIALDHVVQGLGHAHDLGRCHRDVTPGNILRIRDKDGERWVIGDFGLLRRARGESSGPRTRGVVGTPGFEAPEMEILGAHNVDHRADIYSLGMTVGFMVTGAWPDALGNVETPIAWSSLIMKMTAVEVAERFQRMQDIRAALDGVRAAIRDHRVATWKRPTGTIALKRHEIAVLGVILDHGGEGISHEDLRGVRGMHCREVTLGVLGLRARGFIRDGENHHGEVWGVELSRDGAAWALTNDELILAAIPRTATPPPPPPAGGPDDDIPF